MPTKKGLCYFRKMVLEDIDHVMQVERLAYPFPWARKLFEDCLNKPSYTCWVFEYEKKFSGYLISSSAAGEAHILNLCVHPTLQGQGWGRKLLTEAEWIAKQHRADTCFLEVRVSNHAAVHLYNTSGYNEIGRRKKYYPATNGREDAIVMAKVLISNTTF
ncbi:MAG: ribosomal protein S18-alanine N-acetyltransferase [Cocleimonas sp.]|nr:ribosomal protein S18-alanine N-acetyltransferase [Cocleimonas sp.]